MWEMWVITCKDILWKKNQMQNFEIIATRRIYDKKFVPLKNYESLEELSPLLCNISTKYRNLLPSTL